MARKLGGGRVAHAAGLYCRPVEIGGKAGIEPATHGFSVLGVSFDVLQSLRTAAQNQQKQTQIGYETSVKAARNQVGSLAMKRKSVYSMRGLL